MEGRETPWKPSQPATKSNGFPRLCRCGGTARLGRRGIEVEERGVLHAEPDVAAGGQARGDQVLDDLVLRVDGDRSPVSSVSAIRWLRPPKRS